MSLTVSNKKQVFVVLTENYKLYTATLYMGAQCQKCLTHIFVKMALFAPNGLLVTRILLLPETMKCGIGASDTDHLIFRIRFIQVTVSWR
jgi:hypothetical protein